MTALDHGWGSLEGDDTSLVVALFRESHEVAATRGDGALRNDAAGAREREVLRPASPSLHRLHAAGAQVEELPLAEGREDIFGRHPTRTEVAQRVELSGNLLISKYVLNLLNNLPGETLHDAGVWRAGSGQYIGGAPSMIAGWNEVEGKRQYLIVPK